MIFQDAGASLCPVRTIGDQIHESILAHERTTREESDRRALELLNRLGFRDGARILKSYPFELSGGMNQRVGIAVSMLLKPAVLLADEPTSALDVSVQRQAVEEMLLLRELYGTAIVLVTHNIGVIRAMADTVLVLKDGEMVEYGPAEQVLRRPKKNTPENCWRPCRCCTGTERLRGIGWNHCWRCGTSQKRSEEEKRKNSPRWIM